MERMDDEQFIERLDKAIKRLKVEIEQREEYGT